jgi:hypothetical protein
VDSKESPQNSDEAFDAIVHDLRTWARRVERRRVQRISGWGGASLVLVVFVLVALVLALALWHVWSSTPPPSLRR